MEYHAAKYVPVGGGCPPAGILQGETILFHSRLIIVLLFVLLSACGTTSRKDAGSDAGLARPPAGASDSSGKETKQTISAAMAIKGLSVAVDHEGSVFYRVRVNNAQKNEIKLLWDQSAYVTTAGRSVRLVRLDHRDKVPDYAPALQAASIIAPGKPLTAEFTGELWLNCARRNCTPQLQERQGHAKIMLTFEIKGRRVRWQGNVAFDPPAKPERSL